jgi:hypothetical protein
MTGTWVLTLAAAVLYGFIIRDIARELSVSELDTLTGTSPVCTSPTSQWRCRMLTSREGQPRHRWWTVLWAAEQPVPAVAGREEMTDDTRPLLLGFVLKHLLMTDDELAETKQRLEEFAALEGFAMGTIYVEDTATTPAAFEALIEAVNRYEVTAVVVPSLLHFAALAVTHNVKDAFERTTGARVRVAAAPPP